MQSDEAEIVAVDLFAGAGGLSTGMAKAFEDSGLEPAEDVELHAINHWEPAIKTHEQNHPWAEHYHSKIEELHPPDVVEPGTVTVLGGGPECTHFSNARGGKPVSEQKRASAWHVLDWIEKLQPKHVLLENVKEFRQWGPIDEDGQPTRDGSIFRRWIGMLEALGYSVVYDEDDQDHGVVLDASDYGEAQSRKRLFIMASRTKRPTAPEPTHVDDDPTKPDRRTAADIIDWSDRGTSIWTRDLENPRVQPLSQTTMGRIAEGIRRHCDDRLEPMADVLERIGKDDLEALREAVIPLEDAETVAGAVDQPFLVHCPRGQTTLPEPYVLRQHSGGVPAAVDAPLPTVATRGAIGMATASTTSLVQPRNGPMRGDHSNPLYDPESRPIHTITAKNHDGHLVSASLVHYSHGGSVRDVDRPTPTIATEKGGAFALAQSYLCPMYNGRAGQRPRTRVIDRPLMTCPASKSPAGVATPYLVEYYGNSSAQPVDQPLPTVTKKDRFALCIPELWPYGLDVRYRMLQPRELKQAQGFPADYDLAGGTKAEVTAQIGNAVPVHLARALCRHLLADETPSLSSYGGGIQADPDADVPEYEEVLATDD